MQTGRQPKDRTSKFHALVSEALASVLLVALARVPARSDEAAPAAKSASHPSRRAFLLGKWEPDAKE
jgi:hypothetical protein